MQNKKNILEICNGLGLGGTEKTMQVFCKYLDKNKFNVFACGIFKGGEREKLIESNVFKLLVANGDIDKIKQFTLENKIDIVHWHSITQSPGIEFDKSIELLEFFKKKNIKIIETSPFSLFNEKVDDLLDLKLFVSKTNLLKYFWKFGTKIKNRSKYNFLYNPLDTEELEKYKLGEKEKDNLRKKYGIAKDDFVIGKVGRANLWKWEDTIIDIVPHLIKKIRNLKVVIRAIPEIKKKKIKKLGIENYFLFLPESVSEREITETYQLMDIMVHTSRIGECNSVAINEGLFFGLPIITKSTDFMEKTIFTRDNGQIEIIENGKNGFYGVNNNYLIEKILEIYNNQKLFIQIRNENSKKSYNLFNAKNITKKLENIFEGNFYYVFDYKKELSFYISKIDKLSFLELLKINLEAIYDKFINKA